MAYSGSGEFVGFPANADFSGNHSDGDPHQYRAVKLNSSKKLVIAGADDLALGILQDDPKAGETGSVKFMGASKARCGGTFSAGDLLAVDSAGLFVAASQATADASGASATAAIAGSRACAIALEAGAAGRVATVLVIHGGLI